MATDEQKSQVLALELQHLGSSGPIEVSVSAFDAFALIACLQLAWRHPDLSASQKHIIEGFAKQLEAIFAAYPVASSVLSAGWDRGQDVRRSL